MVSFCDDYFRLRLRLRVLLIRDFFTFLLLDLLSAINLQLEFDGVLSQFLTERSMAPEGWE